MLHLTCYLIAFLDLIRYHAFNLKIKKIILQCLKKTLYQSQMGNIWVGRLCSTGGSEQ